MSSVEQKEEANGPNRELGAPAVQTPENLQASSPEMGADARSSTDTHSGAQPTHRQRSSRQDEGEGQEGAGSLDPQPPEQGETAPAKPKDMRWYVVQAYSGYEVKVRISLLERIRQQHMEASFGEVLIPQESVQESRGGNRRVSARTFYPGYIFVEMILNEQTWHLIKDTPKVSGFVGGRNPTPVSKKEISSIIEQVEEGAAKPKPSVVFEQGDYVRVTSGAFANFAGTIEEVKPDKQKVKVLVSIFGRSTPVELGYGEVEKAV